MLVAIAMVFKMRETFQSQNQILEKSIKKKASSLYGDENWRYSRFEKVNLQKKNKNNDYLVQETPILILGLQKNFSTLITNVYECRHFDLLSEITIIFNKYACFASSVLCFASLFK